MKYNSIYNYVIELKEKNLKNKDIADKLGVSLNSIEKTLQLNRLHLKFKEILNKEEYDKLLNLNYKALEIKHIQDDDDSVIKLLDSINEKITLKELKEKIELIKVRKEKIDTIKKDIENISNNIDSIKNEIKDLEKKYKDIVNEMDIKFKFIEEDKSISNSKKAQILKSIAYDKRINKYVFVGFIDTSKYFYLKNKGLIYYDENATYSCGYLPPPLIPDIDKFVQYAKRSKRFKSEFQDRYADSKHLLWSNRKDKELKELSDIKENLAEKRKKLREYNKQLKITSNGDLNDFMTVLEAKNELSKKDILKHNELCVKGMKWLRDRGYIADIEYSHNNYRFDVIGVNLEENKIIILEAKVSLNDYRQDNKKEEYIDYCNELYIITNDYLVKVEAEKKHNIMGIIYCNDFQNSIDIYKSATLNNKVNLDKNEVVKKIYNKYWNKIYKI